MLVWVVEVLIFDELFELLLLEHMFLHVRVLHCRVHVHQSVGKEHILLVYSPLLIPFAPQTACIDDIPDLFLALVPLWVVLILSDTHCHQLSNYVLIFIELACSLYHRSLVLCDRNREFF